MGVRLYPYLKEGVTLNQVIGVSDADYQRWVELEAQYKSKEIDSDTYYHLLYSEGWEGVNELNGFDLFGWGKFECLESMRGEDGYVEYTGSLKDMSDIAVLFMINGISCDMSLIKGVYWG
jgi:hypothetical protein